MPEPALSPNDTLPNVESTTSSSPTQGAGLHLEQNRPQHETLFFGRIEDGYPSANAYLVALYHYKRNFPCFALRGAGGRVFGARDHAPLAIGTEVKVHVPRDGKFGVILGAVPTVEDPPFNRPAGQLVPEGGVNAFSDQEPFDANAFGVARLLPQANAGQPVDALPGDAGLTNESGAGTGLNRLYAWLKGGELAAVEAYVLEDLLRVVGHRLEVLTAAGEERVNNDQGRIARERLVALTQAESLGVADEGDDTCTANPDASLAHAPLESSLKAQTPGGQGRWRLREDEGYLGDFFQRLLGRPARTPRALDGEAGADDLTLFQEYLSRAGQHLERSLLGSGHVKGLAIAGARRLRADDDPEGERHLEQPAPRPAFSLSGGDGGPAGFSCQTRDWLAWQFDQAAKAARADLARDWHVQDDRDALRPGGEFSTPGLGGYFREAPPLADAAQGVGDVPADAVDGTDLPAPFRPGEAFSLLLPDGSTHSRDAWGTETRTGYGHGEMTASKNLTLRAGGSVIVEAGDDIVLRARKSVDISSTDEQVRLKGQRDLLFHTETGGMLFTAPTAGGKLDDYAADQSKGEGVSLAGIAFKTAGTVTTVADTEVHALKTYLYVGGQTDGAHPSVLVRASNALHWLDGTGVWATGSGGSDGVLFAGGSVYATNNFQNDGTLYARGNLVTGGTLADHADFSQVERISEDLKPAFQAKEWTGFQAPYNFQDLRDLNFSFRSVAECGAQDLRSYESAWQRELSADLDAWQEHAVNDTYPYPGREHYDGTKQGFYRYEEGNVERTGQPKARAAQSPQGGTFTPTTYNALPVPPAP